MKIIYIIPYFCFFSTLLLGKVPLEHLKPKVPVNDDSHVAQIYTYYRLVSDVKYEGAYVHLGSLIKDTMIIADFKSLYTETNRPFALAPESVLAVSVEFGDGLLSDQNRAALKGKLVVGVKREFSGQAPLVDIEWSNSFIDLWVMQNGRYVVYPDPFSFFRQEEFRLVYSRGVKKGANVENKITH